jgi:hypothetical protein
MRAPAPGNASTMEPEAKPTPPEALVGKDELDEDDEMELSTDELVETPGWPQEPSSAPYQLAHRPVPTGPPPADPAEGGSAGGDTA